MHAASAFAIGLTIVTLAFPAAALRIDTGINVDASAGSTTSINAQAKSETRIANAKNHAFQEINRRISALNSLRTRIDATERLTITQKSSLNKSVMAQISALESLKGKIDSDVEIMALKEDIKSITKSYRIFLLVIPQGQITISADKIISISATILALSSKLSMRIDAAQAAGKDVASLKLTLSNINSKLASANTKASAAINLVSTLSPDNDDTAKAQINTQALKDARAKIHAAMQDIKDARNDSKATVDRIASFHLDATTQSSVTP